MKAIIKPFIPFSIVLFGLFITGVSYAQVKFSLATDVSLLHNFAGAQSFTVMGQTIHGQWHTDTHNTFYAWFAYHGNGKYKTDLTATAKSVFTQPQQIFFTNHSEMRLRHLSVGFKRYLRGSYDNLQKFNIYVAAGFGLLMGTASNSFSAAIDTSLYIIQKNIISGSGEFKRMSLDITAGWELPLAYEIFVFSEARMHITTTDYPNNYLLKNNNAPFPGSINIGLRFLFNNDQ